MNRISNQNINIFTSIVVLFAGSSEIASLKESFSLPVIIDKKFYFIENPHFKLLINRYGLKTKGQPTIYVLAAP